ncbi:type VI secretion system baseplate subunit TssK [Candidatus Nesciobacter abundans]|uniref:Type VI secretion system baseplate subunit TssK n=1 Tax=Candidatus Nesciobacter abundans TaxID=2601668 RepID=A0A5C0UHM8_9PROT|nr:type VI secretion system baseplate subunit TssK [Candidatus Nesciobacter abundans]QEK39237.1 hypothetical protein FZC36_02265 [Candidatus Nesciobacter abundans]
MIVSKFKFTPYKVQWYEGMPLSPHHFQQSDLTNEKMMGYLISKTSPYHWGLIDMEVDSSKITEGIISINTIEAIMPDRSIIFYPIHDQETLHIKLEEEDFKTSNDLDIFLVKPESRNTYDSQTVSQGYESVTEKDVLDQNNEDHPACILKLKPKYQLAIGEIPNKHIGIQIMKIKNGISGIQIAEFDPPCINISKTKNTTSKIQELIKVLRKKTYYMQNNLKLNSDNNAEVMHSIFMQGIIPLDHILNSNYAHPYTLFTSLINLLAHISGLDKTILLQDIPKYNHKNIFKSFKPLFKFINSILDSIKEPYSLKQFINKDGIFFIDLPKETGNALFVLVKDYSMNFSETMQWIENAVISTQSMLEEALETRVLGLKREYEKTQEDSHVIIKINTDDRFFVKGEKLCIYNRSADKKPSEISIVSFANSSNELPK